MLVLCVPVTHWRRACYLIEGEQVSFCQEGGQDTIERTAAVTDEPHTVSQTSLFSEDGVQCLRVFGSDSDEPERVPTPIRQAILLRMKL